MTPPAAVAFVVPNPEGARTGNEVSALRLRNGLEERGVGVVMVRPDAALEAAVARSRTAGVELVHGFHAWRTGPRARDLAARLKLPYAVTITGTDVAIYAHEADHRDTVRDVLRGAAVILCAHAGVHAELAAVGAGDVPTRIVPKGVVIPESVPERPDTAPDGIGGAAVVLQVAHLRPVKNNVLAVAVLRRLTEAGRAVRLVLLGDSLDSAYEADLVRAAGGPEAWCRIWRPAVQHDRVGAWYAAADIVLNTSDSEGGSNAVLEAMAHGRPVVASAIPANVADLGTDRGRLYPVTVRPGGAVEHDAASLEAALAGLLDDAAQRRRLGSSARQWVAARHHPAREMEAVLGAFACARGA